MSRTYSPEDLITSSPLAWVTLNKFVTENQQPVEFKDHRFLIDLYADMSPDIAVQKSAQVGESVERILKTFWCNKYLKANVIYVLPTNNVVKDFVAPKVNPLISSNPALASLVSKDSESLKQVGDRFTFFKGAFSERDAISITGDILVLDELDRMPSMAVVNTFDSRLQASKLGWRWRLSNPSQVGFGINHYYQDSDQMHWIITCGRCTQRMFIDFAKDDEFRNHYLDQETCAYVCGKCGKPLTNDDRRNGEWVPKYPGRSRRGYWINQLMAPWVTAKRIMEQKEESSIDFFHNFVLGKPFTPSDMVVDRQAIIRACAPSNISKRNVVIGVDQNVNEQIWVAGTPDGIFAYGKFDSWEKIEHLKLMYNAVVVCDPNPYPTKPKQLADKYSDFYICYFKTHEGRQITTWNGSTVYADRTRIIDMVASDINEGKILFRQHPYELEEYIADWANIYRTTVEKENGQVKSEWLKKEGKNSDFSFATVYYRIGLSKVLGNSSELFEPQGSRSTPIGQTGLGDIVDETLSRLDP